jgi:hypothetical protein
MGEKKTDTLTSANFVSSSKHFFNSFSAQELLGVGFLPLPARLVL